MPSALELSDFYFWDFSYFWKTLTSNDGNGNSDHDKNENDHHCKVNNMCIV